MKVFQFLKHRKLFMALSVLCIVGGLAATVARGGFNLGLDFQAGISQRVEIDPSAVKAPIDQVRAALRGIEGNQIQVIGSPAAQEYSIKVKQQGDDKTFFDTMSANVTEALGDAFGGSNIKILQSEYVGPRFSADLASQAAFLTMFALLLILLYSWFRFKLGYAVAAITATLHDTLFMIGIIGAFQLEVSTATVAAVLTIIGYSLNDTIVIFDRMRENSRLMRESPFHLVINTSLTQSFARTIITSLTTLLAVTAIYVFGTGEVQLFGLNMIVGVIVGTYSSLFVASPVLLAWRTSADRAKKARDNKIMGIVPEPKKVEAQPVVEKAPVESADAESAVEIAGDDAAGRRDAAKVRLSREARKRKGKK